MRPTHVKLLDFGIARLVDRRVALTRTRELIGTPRYLSPEQIQRRPPTAASDLYALGCVIWEMLTGAPLFADEVSIHGMLLAHANRPVPTPTCDGQPLSGPVVRLMLRCLAKAPWERPQSAAECLEALADGTERVARSSPNTEVATAPMPTLSHRRSRSPIATAQTTVVGRARELAALSRLVDGDGLRILSLFGPGGIGKTTLVSAAVQHARKLGERVLWLDGGELVRSNQLLAFVFEPVLSAPPDLLVIDRMEKAAGIVEGLRAGVLPQLPPTTRVLLSGRRPLGWQIHPELAPCV